MNRPMAPKGALHTALANGKGLKMIALLTTAAFVVGGVTAGAAASPAANENSPPTANELMDRPWFVKQDGEWFKYAKHNWYEQRREAEYQYSKTVEHPEKTETIRHDAVTHEEYRYQIVVPYWTVEHKQVNDSGNKDVIDWLNKIGAKKLTDGWWEVPDSVIASVNFNPLTVADTGTVNLRAYPDGPNVTVEYRKTEEIRWDDSAAFDIKQDRVMYWNGSRWVTNSNDAAWVTVAPTGGTQYGDSRTVTEKEAWNEEKVITPAWTETVYATADGGTTTNKADAGWLTKAPEGDGWTQIGEARYPEWNDDDPWHQVDGYEWTKGKDPGDQPEFYDGYNAETQRFRPVVKNWKLKLEAPPPGDDTPPPPPPSPSDPAPEPDPTKSPPPKVETPPVPSTATSDPAPKPDPAKPPVTEEVADQEASKLPPKTEPRPAKPGKDAPVKAEVPTVIDAGL